MAFDPITAIANAANTVLERVLPDKSAQDAAKAQLLTMQLSGELQQVSQQIDVDKAEASSSSIFVAGWRPFIGWICGVSLGYEYILRPLLTFVVLMFHGKFVAPGLDIGDLLTLMSGMLGLGAMRTVEKVQGVATVNEDGTH
jgi:hypothetical protein